MDHLLEEDFLAECLKVSNVTAEPAVTAAAAPLAAAAVADLSQTRADLHFHLVRDLQIENSNKEKQGDTQKKELSSSVIKGDT